MNTEYKLTSTIVVFIQNTEYKLSSTIVVFIRIQNINYQVR